MTPCSVLVLKKLGSDLFDEMIEVINYLGKVEGMRVIVEPQEYEALVGASTVRVASPSMCILNLDLYG